MSKWDEDRLPADLRGVAGRLRAERRDPTHLELDRLKRRAMARASATPARGTPVRSRLLAVVLTGGLLIGATGGVLAASGGNGNNGNSSNSQYCPSNSPNAGKPKHPGPAACGRKK